MSRNKGFFATKRPWSTIKDNVLSHYLPAYLAKIARLNRRILLVDAFAGSGLFADGTIGSPLLICEQAEKWVPGKYQAVFINKEKKYHDQLEANLRARGYTKSALTVLGDAQTMLKLLPDRITNQSLFLYLDPFGLKDCEFELLRPFLNRDRHASTELLFLLHMPIVHRLAMTRQVAKGQPNPKIAPAFHNRLTQIFGGAYWQDSLWNTDLSPEERENQLVAQYVNQLRGYSYHVHWCPVRESQGARIKYYLVFASRHPDAVEIMNDVMAKAYHGYMHYTQHKGDLWESMDWRKIRPLNNFDDDIEGALLRELSRQRAWTRKSLIFAVIEQNFMRYTQSEYREALKTLKDKGMIIYNPDPQTRRLNDNSHIALRDISS